MKKFKNTLYILMFTCLLLIPGGQCYVHAEEETDPPIVVESNITLDKSTLSIEVGDTSTLVPTVTPDDATIEWSTNDSSVATVVGGVVTGRGIGTAVITATSGGKNATCSVTVAAKPVVIEKSNDATLKSLAIKNGTLDKSFAPNTLEYSVTVESTVKSLVFSPAPITNSNKANYQIAGNDNLKDDSIVKVIITAEDGTINTYKFTIVKAVTLGLKSLKLSGYALNETFNADTLDYTATIPNEVTTVTVQAAATDEDYTVTTSGNTNLKVGTNKITVTVKDKDNNSKVYKIIVTRDIASTVEEKPTSIITSSLDSNPTSGAVNINTPISGSNGTGDSFLKYAIVSLACLMLFAIGGIGIYFYFKTSPRKLRKELEHMKQAKEVESSIIEVEQPKVNPIEQAMAENLVDTKEFKPEVVKIDDLLDDREDV